MKYKYDVFISYSRRDYVDESYNVIPGNAIAEIQNVFDEKLNVRPSPPLWSAAFPSPVS